MTGINPITGPALADKGLLTFQNAAVDADFAQAPGGYVATWSIFDNATGGATMLATSAGRGTEIQAPALPVAPGVFVQVDLRATGAEISSQPAAPRFRRNAGAI